MQSRLPKSAVMTATAVALSLAGGCGRFGLGTFPPGTYSGEADCTIHAVRADGTSGEDEFVMPGSLTIDADGMFSINGEEIVVGQQVVRSIPTADLSLEITDVARGRDVLRVEYAPRPTLPGISVAGVLIETYRWDAGSIEATGIAVLVVTDIEGAHTFTIECEGTLTR